MTWINRYVSGVKRYLPRGIRDDVGDELRSILEDKIEEAQESREGPLEEADVVSIIKNLGHPLKVASRYQSRGALISEALFPIYLQTLKYVTLIFVVLYLLWIGIGASVAAWPDVSMTTMASAYLLCLACMTVAFHYWGRHLVRSDFFNTWNPRSLPPAPPDDSIVSLSESLFALVIIVGWFAILSWISHAATSAGYGSALYSWAAVTFEDEHRGAAVLLWLKIHAVISFGTYVLLLFSPYWSRAKRLLAAGGSYLFALICAMASLGVSRAIGFCGTTDLCGPFDANFPGWAEINLSIFAAVAFAVGTYDVYRAYTVGRPRTAPAP